MQQTCQSMGKTSRLTHGYLKLEPGLVGGLQLDQEESHILRTDIALYHCTPLSGGAIYPGEDLCGQAVL